MSLLLLTFMSVERFVSISHPFGERKLSFRTALVSAGLIWCLALVLALVPGSELSSRLHLSMETESGSHGDQMDGSF